MAFPSALLILPVLDVVALHLLQWVCPLIGLQEPLLVIWIVALPRLFFLSRAVNVLGICLSEWLQKQLILFAVTLSLLIPCYVTASTAVGSSAAYECLHGWWRWNVIALSYLISVVVAVICHHLSPFGQEEEEKHSASLGKLFSCMKPELCRFLIIALFVVISCLSETVMPYYTGRMTDWIGNEKDSSAFDNAIRAMAIITAASAVLEFLCDNLYYLTMGIIHMRIQGQIFRGVLRQELAFFDSTSTGVITSRITTDTNAMSESLSEKLSLLMWYSMRVFFLYGFMLWVSWKLALLTLIGLPVIMVIPKLSGTFYQNLAVQVQESLSKANHVALETFSNMKTVRSFANEDGEAERYMEKLQDTYQLNKKEAMAYTGFMWTNNFSGLALKVAILYYGGSLVTSGMVSEGALVAFVLYELQFTAAVQALLSTYPDVKGAVGASEKIFEYMDRMPKISPSGTLAPENLYGRVTFDNVTFCYPGHPDTPVLKMALVSQEPVLFARSVQENISYGLGVQLLDAVEKVAKQANAHEFITTLNDGYNTDAGERGGQLSGGEKQRVAIARALMRDPKILILDDATSSLDTESEHLVQNTIYSSTRQRTVLVIAHRISMVEQADKIIVLEGGEIKEQGTHQELLDKKGSYWRLVQKQLCGTDGDHH